MGNLDPAGLREAVGLCLLQHVRLHAENWLRQHPTTARFWRRISTPTSTASARRRAEIIAKFKLRNQVRHMAEKDVLLGVHGEVHLAPDINSDPTTPSDPDGRKLPR
jgi:hypothetical protein